MLRDLGGGVWSLDLPLRIAGLPLGARMTILRLDSGGLLLHSPVPISDADADDLAHLGEPRFLLAPSLFHYKFLPAAKARFPGARALGAPGLAEKRKELPLDGVLAPGSTELPGIEVFAVGGMPKLGELALLHRASRTLVVTDLLFYHPEPRGFLFRTYLRLTGGLGKPTQTLLLRSLTKDRRALAATVKDLLARDWDRLIMSHGEPILSGGKDALRAATSWVA